MFTQGGLRVRTDKEILDEIEESWEETEHDPRLELTPEAINWLIEKAREAVNIKS